MMSKERVWLLLELQLGRCQRERDNGCLKPRGRTKRREEKKMSDSSDYQSNTEIGRDQSQTPGEPKYIDSS